MKGKTHPTTAPASLEWKWNERAQARAVALNAKKGA